MVPIEETTGKIDPQKKRRRFRKLKRKFVSVLFALVLALSLSLVTAVPAAPVEASPDTTWYVDGTLGTDNATQGTGPGANAFLTIQYAIDDTRVGTGDTISVAAGTYSENVNVNKSLTLTGASSATVTVGATGEDNVFDVTASSVTISEFTANGANVEIYPHPVVEGFEIAGYAGIYLSPGVTGCNIHDNILTGNVYGILLLEAEDTVIPGNNTFTSNTATNNVISGIEMQHTYGNTFTSNNASSNGKYGITLDSARNNLFTGNTANSNGREGFWLKQGQGIVGSCNNIFTGNTANLNTWSGIHMTNLCGNTTYTGNTFDSNLKAGMELGGTVGDNISNLTVNNNSFSGNPTGILIREGAIITSVVLRNNDIVGNANYGVNNLGAGTLDATNNWWGMVNGPYHEDNTFNIYDQGDTVSYYVDYCPWLDAAYATGASFAPVNNTDTGAQFSSIGAAVDNATAGDTVTAAAGTYTEDLTIDKSLTLQGAGAEETALDDGYYVEIELGWDDEVEPGPLAETVVFDGFYLENEEYLIEIYEVNNGSSLTISNNILYNCGAAIYSGATTTDNGSSVFIEGNEISLAGDGIYFQEVAGGSELTIRDNAIYENEYGIDIDAVVEESTVTMVGNIVGGYMDENVEYGGNTNTGIYIDYVVDSTVTIGGDTEAEANIIGDNGWEYSDEQYAAGICIFETDNATVAIQGNIIGAYQCEEFVTWGNYWAGISLWYIYESTVTIGGDTRQEGNGICGNDGEGIYIEYLEATSLEILNNGILANGFCGVDINDFDEDSTVDIHYNSIVGHSEDGVYHNSPPYTINATGNFWGDVAGPDTSGGSPPHNPYTYWTGGDAVSEYVDYLPWMILSGLVEDWNIWSRPIAPDEDSWVQMQAELVEDGIEAIYYYDNSNQQWGIDPDEANLLDAFYIKMPASTSIRPTTIRYCISSEATWPAQKAMKAGWNFVGLTELYKLQLDGALIEIFYPDEIFSKVISPPLNQVLWTHLVTADPAGKDLIPTRGYWVFMLEDVVLSGFTTTPIGEGVPLPGPPL